MCLWLTFRVILTMQEFLDFDCTSALCAKLVCLQFCLLFSNLYISLQQISLGTVTANFKLVLYGLFKSYKIYVSKNNIYFPSVVILPAIIPIKFEYSSPSMVGKLVNFHSIKNRKFITEICILLLAKSLTCPRLFPILSGSGHK